MFLYLPNSKSSLNFATRFLYLSSNTWLKLAKNQAKTKRRTKAELLLFENYLLSSSVFVTLVVSIVKKVIGHILNREQKTAIRFVNPPTPGLRVLLTF